MRKPTVRESVYAPARNGGMELVRYAGGQEAVVPAAVNDIPVTSVGPKAFSDCPIVSAELPEGLLSLGQEAFSGCTRLREIRLPASLREIGSSAFLRCSSLRSFSLPENHPAFRVEEGLLLDRRGKTLLCCPAGRLDREIRLPVGVVSVAENAFAWCVGPRSIDLGLSLAAVQDEAFSMCTSLRSLRIPDNVTSIEYKAFNNCDQLTLVVGRNSYAERYCRQFHFPCRHEFRWPWQK